VYDWIVLDFFAVACENRLGIWYFCLSEQLSPERKHKKLIPWFCARSRLGKSLSSKRDSLAWARIRPEFGLLSVLSLAQAKMTRLSERAFLPMRDLLAWARTPAVECYFFVSNWWSYVWMLKYELNYDIHELLWLVLCVVKLHEVGIWEEVVELEFQGKFWEECFSVCKDIRTQFWLVSWRS